jgi:hypothetical protein
VHPHAIPSFSFRFVHRLIRSSEYELAIDIGRFNLGDTQAYGHWDPAALEEKSRSLNLLSKLFRDYPGTLAGRSGKNDDEFLAPVACQKVNLSQ